MEQCSNEAIIPIAFLFLLLSIGIFFSRNPFFGWYSLIKLAEYIALGFVLIRVLAYRQYWNLLVVGLCCGIVFESGLAIAQLFLHGSIGGIFYFFGERTFSSSTPGIANASVGGQLLLRPYGTFSHPNVLAGYLVIAMILVSRIWYLVFGIRKVVIGIVLFVGTSALLITLSRVAILVWGFICLYSISMHVRKKIHTTFYLLLTTTSSLLVAGIIFFFTPIGNRFFISPYDESVVYRVDLLGAATHMITTHIFFGVGFGNFLSELPFFSSFYSSIFVLQPVHNIFMLVFAETGLPGFLFFLWFIYATIKNIQYPISNTKYQINTKYKIQNTKYILVFSILVLGFFDHYFFTLQQGQLLLTLVFALCWTPLHPANAGLRGAGVV